MILGGRSPPKIITLRKPCLSHPRAQGKRYHQVNWSWQGIDCHFKLLELGR